MSAARRLPALSFLLVRPQVELCPVWLQAVLCGGVSFNRRDGDLLSKDSEWTLGIQIN